MDDVIPPARKVPLTDGLPLPGERLDDLARDGMRILQKADGFRFGMDSVLLASFAAERARGALAADLGTGSGVLPLLVCARQPKATFDAIEIQPDIAGMARRSVSLNGLDARIRVHAMDVCDAPARLGYEKYDLVVSNPPYGRRDAVLLSPDTARRTARHEGEADIGDFCRAAFSLLRNGGYFAVVFPAPRLLELMDAMRAARLSPKRVLLVHPSPDKAPNLALVDAGKAARPGLHFLPPLFVRGEDGRETEGLRAMYER